MSKLAYIMYNDSTHKTCLCFLPPVRVFYFVIRTKTDKLSIKDDCYFNIAVLNRKNRFVLCKCDNDAIG